VVSLLNWLKRDWQQFFAHWQPEAPLAPGMYTYQLSSDQLSSGNSSRRVHLRISDSGQAVLFVDVTDVVHLNRTAAQFAKWALEGVPRQVAERRSLSHCDRQDYGACQNDLVAMYDFIDRLRRSSNGCATCGLTGVQQQPLFSMPIDAPYKADLAITYKCNNDCPHCYNEADRLTLEAMPVEDWKQVIDRLHQVGVPHLIFTGGEATLYRELPELVAYANELGPICGLNTNGRRFSQGDYARQLAAAGLNHVQITVGSHRPDVHDRMMNARAFEQTVLGIQRAQEAGLHTITNTTLMRMNAAEIESTIDFLYHLGIRTFAINGMIYSGGGFDSGQSIPEQEMQPLLIRIRDHAASLGMKFLWYTPTMYCRLSPVELEIGAKRCNAGEYSICVEPNADILPCQSFYVAAGNLLRDPWESIWNSSLFHSFRDRELDPQGAGLPEMCWQCPDLNLCGGGCRIEREAAAGLRTAGGCASGGCSSRGCSSGGCASTNSTTQVDFSTQDTAGFVAIESLQIAGSTGKRRGTGVFSD
jgi:radical SAM protein with 4Fe4S-binding SPASM domain